MILAIGSAIFEQKSPTAGLLPDFVEVGAVVDIGISADVEAVADIRAMATASVEVVADTKVVANIGGAVDVEVVADISPSILADVVGMANAEAVGIYARAQICEENEENILFHYASPPPSPHGSSKCCGVLLNFCYLYCLSTNLFCYAGTEGVEPKQRNLVPLADRDLRTSAQLRCLPRGSREQYAVAYFPLTDVSEFATSCLGGNMLLCAGGSLLPISDS